MERKKAEPRMRFRLEFADLATKTLTLRQVYQHAK